jgi:murein DD-endopeptidase MepM/ murein hydrolase activator NlpD
MEKHFTLMIIPDKNKEIKTLRIPAFIVRSSVFLSLIFLIVSMILAYNYWTLLSQVYENKYLTLENKQLKDQVQIFQMKMNSLSTDFKRIEIMEKKLRLITGLEDLDLTTPLMSPQASPVDDKNENIKDRVPDKSDSLKKTLNNQSQTNVWPFKLNDSDHENANHHTHDEKFEALKKLYHKKISQNMGQVIADFFGKDWSLYSLKTADLAKLFTEFDYSYNLVKSKTSEVELNLNDIDIHLMDKFSMIKSTPTIMPTPGWITSYYGQRVSPYSGGIKMHEGIDVGAPTGTPIWATADGIVTFAGTKIGFGKYVHINHGYGVETIYAHAHTVTAQTGQKIKRGEMIAKVGSTGYSTGPHLHYEVRVNGVSVDPLYFILAN